jgi:hypothetical protein
VTIAVDFDVPVHLYSKGWMGGDVYDGPTEGAFRAIQRLMEVDCVFVFTARPDLEAVAAWLTRRGGFETVVDDGSTTFWDRRDVLLVTNRKLPAYVYVDDRAVRFESWEQTLDAISELGYYDVRIHE